MSGDTTAGHEKWMREALRFASIAAGRGEVPIGAVLVRDGELLAGAHDSKELTGDPTAHAEILVIREAAERLGDWRLDGAELYVTLEPCPMCAGAMLQARVAKLVFGASNPRWGACGTEFNLLGNPRFNHQVKVEGGVLAEECGALLSNTFRQYRAAEGARPERDPRK